MMKANLSSSQIFCTNCEEIVHAYAVRCPYCSKDLNPAPTSEKITQLHEVAPASIVAMPQAVAIEDEAPSALPEGFTVLISLAALLAASFFFFFGVIIKLFSVEGVFVLEWKASSWPYFVGSSLVLLALGLYTLSKLEKESL